MQFPHDYVERVYAGVLGKIIGVYLGRPFEGWSYERIMRELGEIRYYVHENRGVPLIVTDDDISGTFTFFRALADHGNSADLTAEQIGQTWLNYLIEKKTILWWGGMGNSTEHTAYLRLKRGIPAPLSGAIETNGQVVAEQIGGQIFIDAWPMIYPGEPEKAAELARRAASVSHDGEGIYGAQVLAAMEAKAFTERDLDRLIETGVSVIPQDSVIYRMIEDLRLWHAKDNDWQKTFHRIECQYGYDQFPGNCHMVPNHALIILGLLYGQGDFQESLMITNTCGWDTDCNSGNLGALLGIRNGLAGFEGNVDWRGPVADRMYLPTMDGGRCVTDAVIESYHIINSARAIRYLPLLQPKNGARFHFELPGSLQGFRVDAAEPPGAQVTLENTAGHSRQGERSLAVHFSCPPGETAVRVSTPTFILPEDLNMPGYSLIASPTLYPGQIVQAGFSANVSHKGPVQVALFVCYYDASNQPARLLGPLTSVEPGEYQTLSWQMLELRGMPIYAVGMEIRAGDIGEGTVYLDYLNWNGVADTTFGRPEGLQIKPNNPNLWSQAWVCAADTWERNGKDAFRIGQNEGRGLITTGLQEWEDYYIRARIRPSLMKSGGLAVRVQGLRRYYAFLLSNQKMIQLVRVFEGKEVVLSEVHFEWQPWNSYDLALEVRGDHFKGWVNGHLVLDFVYKDTAIASGAIGLVVEEGFLITNSVKLHPVSFTAD
ncbi:MAG TPA: ADP-ribosylglycohydrolase family protein [Anaerolineales bacterium]|nr:ADP-ribosylglycohydrolase family protein [Anaerolineales bacterium]